MNIQFQRAVDRYAGIPLCWLLSQVERVRLWLRPRASAPQPRRILIILLSEMGSLVLAQPMFAALRRRYPDATLHVLMFAKNREVLDLLDVIPRGNVLTLDDRSVGSFLRDTQSVFAAMRQLRFDVVIDCELFSRVSSILSYMSGAAVRVGFHPHTQEGLYRGSFINRPVMYNPYRHLSQQFLTLVAAIESRSQPAGKIGHISDIAPPPKLVFAAGEVAQVASQLEHDFPVLQRKKLVLIYPSGGLLPIRAWPQDNYVQLARRLLADGYAVGVIGLPADRAYAEAVARQCDHESCVNLAGYTKTVRHLLAIFQRASLLVTNDGGPGQFAALTDVPTLVFFGPETPALYSPLADNIHCLYSNYSCSPCLTAYNHRASPCDGDNQCVKVISVEQVATRARSLLAAALAAADAAGDAA